MSFRWWATLKKAPADDEAAVAYNFIKIHRTLRVTPAMAAKVTDRLFAVSDIVALVEAAESKEAA